MTKFQLEIRYPNKYDAKYKLGYVYFDTETKRESYIRDEFKYCRTEEKSYLSALHPNQRLNTVRDLYNKRITFAKDNNLTITTVK